MEFRHSIPFLLLCLLMVFPGCAKLENVEEDIVGTWKFNQVDYTSDIIRVTCPDCSANLTEDYEGQVLEFNEDKSFMHLDANDSILFAGNWEVREEINNYFDRFGEIRASSFVLDLTVDSPPEPLDYIIRNTGNKRLDVMHLDTAGTFYIILKPN